MLGVSISWTSTADVLCVSRSLRPFYSHLWEGRNDHVACDTEAQISCFTVQYPEPNPCPSKSSIGQQFADQLDNFLCDDISALITISFHIPKGLGSPEYSSRPR